MVEVWQALVGLTALVGLYWFGVAVLGAPASAAGFVVVALFCGLGVLAGRLISERLLD
jgi:hypothetical protein